MLISRSKRDILCIDWDERSLRVLETTFHRATATVRRAVHANVPEGLDVRDPSAMGDFIRRTLGEHRIRARRAMVDVPRQDTVLNRLSLPTGTMDELAAMVHLQIAKELPFSKEQAVIDFAVVPKPGGATCDVWVAAIRINVLQYYRQVFVAAGLQLEGVGLRPYANVRALQEIGATEGRVVLVDVGPSMTEIDILRDGALMYTRAASVMVPEAVQGTGAQASPAPTKGISASLTLGVEPWSMDNLLIEVNRTIAAYRATDLGSTIDRVVLAGTAGISERLVQAFRGRFNVQTEVFSVPESIQWRPEARATAPFSACAGLILSQLGETAQRFDFLHVKEPQAEHRQRVKRRPVVAATVAMFVVAGAVAAYQPIRMKHGEIDAIKKQIAVVNADAKDRAEALKRVADLYSWQERDVVWVDYLKRLASVFPSNKDCFLTKMEVNSTKGTITLSLVAADRFMAAKLVDLIKTVTDNKGQPIFDAVPAAKAGISKEPDYPVSDEVTVTVLSLAPKKKTKTSRR